MTIYMYEDTIVITNRKLVKGDFGEQIRKVVSLHPYGLILREKDLSDEDYETLFWQVLRICQDESVPCFVHSRFGIATKLSCRNIHFSLASLQEHESSLDSFEQVSVSCHSLEDVRSAINHGATQIILGTVFETACKPGMKGKGLSFVREIADYCRLHGDIPVFAIGGITPDNIGLVKEAGARGGCMMSHMMNGI